MNSQLHRLRGADRRWRYLFLLIAWAALIFIASSIPNPPDVGGGDWRYEVAHVVEYAVFGALAFLTLQAWRPQSPRLFLALAAWAIAIAYGISDEFHQSFVPNRDASALDVGFDAVGAGLGVLVVALVLQKRFKERGPGTS